MRRFHDDPRGAAYALLASLSGLVLVVTAGCGSSDATPITGGGTGGKATAQAGAPGAGGASTGGAASPGGAGGDPSVCHASSFSTAPRECLQDWSHAKAKYTAKCKMDGGYQAHCDPYDTILVDSGSDSVACFYESGTGNLIGARSTVGSMGVCVAFDTAFVEPDRGACIPAAGGCSGMP
jgi:hypothetical protein